MRKILLAAAAAVIALALFGCKQAQAHKHTYIWHCDANGHSQICACGALFEKAASHTDADQNNFCDTCKYPLEAPVNLSEMFKTAYANAFPSDMEIDRDSIEVTAYHGMIGQAHIVSIDSSYLDKAYPNGVYIESVEGMEFRYDRSYKVYIISNEKLYSAKAAYENRIIDFNSLCKIFGLHTAKLSTFNAEAYHAVIAAMEADGKETDDHELSRYYGEYNGFHAVSLNFLGGQAAVCFEESVGHLRFEYGYQANRIRFMNGTESYTLGEAFENGIITQEDVYTLFQFHTKSQTTDEALMRQLLTPAYELCLKYKDDFDRDVDFDCFYLKKYYGQYGNSHIYALHASCWIRSSSTSATPEEIEVMEYGFSSIAYVLNDGKLYTLDQALNRGIISEAIKNEIREKYYE